MLSDIMLTGKAISRAVRGHMLVDAALNTILVAKAYRIPLPTKGTDEPKRDTASTDPENDDVETDQQKQGTVDVTSDINKRNTSTIRQCYLRYLWRTFAQQVF